MSSLFTYQPLNGENPARFLSLLPSELDGAIRCEIHHDDLSNHQPYHAVSYTWGPPEPTILIQVSGKQLPVRENLFLFLRNMMAANPDGLQKLWIDALCIDQNNIEEKNQQVPQMGRIYSGAQSVLVWLGPASSKIDFAFDAFERVRKQFHDMQDGDVLTNPTVFINAMPTGEEFEFSILDLLNREYWTRVWIVQELFLTTRGRVICGSGIMRLEDLGEYCSNMRFLNMLSCQKLQTSPGFKICCRAARYKTDRHFRGALFTRGKTASTHHAWALVNWVVDQHCSDIRDKLYGLLGIAADGPGFVVDYSSSLLFKAIRHFALLNSIHSVDHLRKLLGLTKQDLANYTLTDRGRQEEEIWISVFMESFSSYVGDHDQVFDCRPPNNRVELQADDIIFDFDGRDNVPKEVLLFHRKASGYVCLAVVAVYPVELKEPPICRDEEVRQPRHILIGLVDSPVFRSLRFSDIRQRSHGEISSENVEIPIPPEVLLFLMCGQTPFESTKGLPPEAIYGNPLQAASWCRSRTDATRPPLDWHNFLRYKGSGNPGQEGREGKFIYWS